MNNSIENGSIIKILPKNISNKIAAGEIIERPISIVKELVENSIDALSTKIIIEIKKGGVDSIRVIDNGIGMNKENLLKSIERFSTSKIEEENDIYLIKTLGFRGEALSSIAAISKISIISLTKNDKIGNKIKIIGGEIQEVTRHTAPHGTMIRINDLFFNTPARKKFIKSINNETRLISNFISNIAMAHKNISFKFISNNRILKVFPKTTNLSSRIKAIIGNKLTSELIPINVKTDNILITGWISNILTNQRTSKGIHLFVNKRYVKNNDINQSITAGYNDKLIKKKQPLAIIYINTPPNQLDVNIHPKKDEVKFLEKTKIQKLLSTTIKETLDKFNRKQLEKIFDKTTINTENKNNKKINFNLSLKTNNNKKLDYNSLKNNILENNLKIFYPKSNFPKNVFVTGQYDNSYILCEYEKMIIIIDQHAAHERILFENFKKNISEKKIISQTLLLPEIIELNNKENKILEKLIPKLKKFGLNIEFFGNNTFIIKSIPVIIKKEEMIYIILELIKRNPFFNTKNNFKTIIEKYLYPFACHKAIKANKKLNYEEMKKILLDLSNCSNPNYCPHGRPIWIKLNFLNLEKKFKRNKKK